LSDREKRRDKFAKAHEASVDKIKTHPVKSSKSDRAGGKMKNQVRADSDPC
jgi:hypothetical protein